MRNVIGVLLLCFLVILSFNENLDAQSASDDTGSASGLAAEEDSLLWNYLGLYVGFNLNQHSADFRALPGVPNCCPRFADGDGTGFAFGALFDMPFSREWWLQVRAGLSQRDAELSRVEEIGNAELNGNSSVPAIGEHSLKATLSYVGLEPTAVYRGFTNFSLSAGFVAGSWLSADYDQIETLLTPSDVAFLDGSRTRNASAGEIPEKESLYLAGVIGAAYELPVGERMFLAPELRYYIPFTNVSSVDWTAGGLQIGAALRMQLGSPEKDIVQDTVYIRDTVETVIAGLNAAQLKLADSNDELTIEEFDDYILERTTITENYLREIPRAFVLEASVSVQGIAADGRRESSPTVVIEETEVFETLPLLPYVFFAEESGDLASARLKLLTSNETATFQANKLKPEALNIYAHNLNVIGFRLQQIPGAKITITGCNSNTGAERGNTQLSRRRAESVKQYLQTVWGIAENRISVKSRNLPQKPSNNSTPDGQAENRRVEISSRNRDLLVPVSIKDITVEAYPPTLEILGTVYAEGGLEQYSIQALQGNQQLRSYTGSDTSAVHRWTVLNEPRPATQEAIAVKYSAVDNAGKSVSASTSVPIKQLTLTIKRGELKDDKRIEIFSLILFDFGKASLDSRNKSIMNKVRSSIQPNSIVTIYGYADRSGEADFNRELARKRSEEARKNLQGVVPDEQMKVIAVGSDELIYDNDLPEGRSYSRTVRIVVETPVTE